LRIDAVGLGQLTGGTCEITHLTRVDHDDWQLPSGQCSDHQQLIATAGLEHNALGLECRQLLDQCLEGGITIGHLPPRTTRLDRHVQGGFADVDADPLRLGCRVVVHGVVPAPGLSRVARPCGYGLAAVAALATVRAELETDGTTWLPDGLRGPRSDRSVPSA